MSCVRPRYGDAASRLSIYSHVSSISTRSRNGELHAVESNYGSETTSVPTTGQRLPSRRSINQRWDRSRGLFPSNARPAPVRDVNGPAGDTRTLSAAPASRRCYAMRRTPNDSSSKPSSSTPASSSGGLGSMAQPARQGAPPVQGSPKELAEKQIAQLKQQLRETELRLSSEQQSLQRAREELESLRRKNIDDKEAMLKKGREEGRKFEAAKLGQEIEAQRIQIKHARKATNTTERKLTELQSQLEQQGKDWAQDRDSLSHARQDQERRLLKQFNEHRKELLEMKHSLEERQGQRKTYGTYRDIFDGVHSARVLLRDQQVNMQHDGLRARSTIERLQRGFRKFQTEHSNIPLFGKILSAVADQHAAAGAEIERTISCREDLRSEDMRLKSVAHDSRLYTQSLRYNIHADAAEILDSVVNYAGDNTLGERIGDLVAEIDGVSKQIDQADNATLKEDLQARKAALYKRKAPLDTMKRLLKVQRHYVTLKAWREAPYPRKAAFDETHDLIVKRREVMRKWYDELEVTASRSDRVSEKDFEEAQAARRQHRQRAQKVADELDKLALVAKQHADLREREGRHVEHERKVNESIDRRIAQAYKSVHLVEDQLFGELRLAKAAARPDTSPRIAAVARTGRSARAASPVQVSMAASEQGAKRAADLKLGDLKQQMQSAMGSNDQSAVDALSRQYDQLKKEVNQIALESLVRKQATLPKSRQRAAAVEIARLRRAIDSATTKSTSVAEDTEESGQKEVTKSATSAPSKGAENHKVALKTKKPTTMRERRKSLVIRRTVGSNTYSEEPRRAGLNIKPTSSKQAAHAFVPVLSFQATQAGSLPSLDGLDRETRDLGAKDADARWLGANFDNTPQSAPASSEHLRMNSEMSFSAPRRDDDDDSNYSGESSFVNISDFEDDASSNAAKQSGETSSNNNSSDQGSPGPDNAPAEDDDALTFQIPKDDFRKALMASPSSTGANWSCSLYKDPEGNGVKRHYCTTYEQTETQAKNFLDAKVLGFDLEWEPNAWPGKASAKRCVSLIQIASEDRVGLFQVALFKGDSAAELMPPLLRKILESPDIVKAGVNIGNDASRLEKCLGVNMRGLFELSHIYKVITYGETAPHKVNRRPYRLADQVKEALHLPLAKGEVRVSAWSKRLNPQQVEYAANDAYAGFRLYHAFEAKRKTMTPPPPGPAFWELHEPLVLGDGTKIYPASTRPNEQPARQAPEKEQVDDDEADEEFFDAVEDMEALEQVAAGVPLAGIQVKYPDLPTFEDLHISQKNNDIAAPKPAAATNNKFPSSEAFLASEWAAQYRDSHQPIRASQPTLRAYHVWQVQGFTPKQTAALLREEPLSLNTVASYVAEAVVKQELEFDRERMREVMEILPRSVWYRYRGIVERVFDEVGR